MQQGALIAPPDIFPNSSPKLMNGEESWISKSLIPGTGSSMKSGNRRRRRWCL
jgi:hypothetical protein